MYCILVSGLPASGKSTAAKLISEKFGIPCFSKDSIKECLFDTIGFSCRAEKNKLNLAATETLYYIAEQFMKNKLPFVLENNFETKTSRGIIDLVDRYCYRAISVALTGDYKKIYERFCERQHSPYRHRGHVVNDCYPEVDGKREVPPMSFEYFVGFAADRGMDSFRVNGENIVVDTTDIQNVDWNGLFEKIKLLVT